MTREPNKKGSCYELRSQQTEVLESRRCAREPPREEQAVGDVNILALNSNAVKIVTVTAINLRLPRQ
jgi:hypothetical protein